MKKEQIKIRLNISVCKQIGDKVIVKTKSKILQSEIKYEPRKNRPKPKNNKDVER